MISKVKQGVKQGIERGVKKGAKKVTQTWKKWRKWDKTQRENKSYETIRLSLCLIFMLIALLSFSFLSTGCTSNVTGSWDCPAEEGYHCIPIKTADRMAVQGLKTEKRFKIKVHKEEKRRKKESTACFIT